MEVEKKRSEAVTLLRKTSGQAASLENTPETNFAENPVKESKSSKNLAELLNVLRVRFGDEITEQANHTIGLYTRKKAIANGIVAGIDDYIFEHSRFKPEVESIKEWNEAFVGNLKEIFDVLSDTKNISIIESTARSILKESKSHIIVEDNIDALVRYIASEYHGAEAKNAAIEYFSGYAEDTHKIFHLAAPRLKTLFGRDVPTPRLIEVPVPNLEQSGEYDHLEKKTKINLGLGNDEKLSVVVHEMAHSLQDHTFLKEFTLAKMRKMAYKDFFAKVTVIHSIEEGGSTFSEEAYRSFELSPEHKTRIILEGLVEQIRRNAITFDWEAESTPETHMIKLVYKMLQTSDSKEYLLNKLEEHAKADNVAEFEKNEYVLGAAVIMILFVHNDFDVKKTLDDTTKNYKVVFEELREMVHENSSDRKLDKLFDTIDDIYGE